MKKKYICRIAMISLLSCSILLSGCTAKNTSREGDTPLQNSAAVSEQEKASNTDTIVEEAKESTEPSATSDTEAKAITITVVNSCGIEIGMISVIDPITGEQVNLDSLSDGESISLEANWPSSVKEFQWALYNTSGELCIESKTDISAAKTGATLVLTGDGNLENVEESFQ